LEARGKIKKFRCVQGRRGTGRAKEYLLSWTKKSSVGYKQEGFRRATQKPKNKKQKPKTKIKRKKKNTHDTPKTKKKQKPKGEVDISAKTPRHETILKTGREFGWNLILFLGGRVKYHRWGCRTSEREINEKGEEGPACIQGGAGTESPRFQGVARRCRERMTKLAYGSLTPKGKHKGARSIATKNYANRERNVR